jgi:hypothetical protein
VALAGRSGCLIETKGQPCRYRAQLLYLTNHNISAHMARSCVDQAAIIVKAILQVGIGFSIC